MEGIHEMAERAQLELLGRPPCADVLYDFYNDFFTFL